jgi:small subunit ribosomal protein S16
VILADSRSPRDVKFIEELGYFDPLKDPAEIKIDGERAKKWISDGAQPTDTVKALLKKAGVLE